MRVVEKLLETLAHAEFLGSLPHTVIVGIESEDIAALSLKLSETVRFRLEDLVSAVLQEIAKVGEDVTSPDASLDIKSYLASAAPALYFDGNLAPFCELLEKVGRLVRAGDAFFVHPDDDIPAA